ncbi:MAG: APC family permease [Actinomycetes bacterium]|nr:APC family permease [Actinomycetes bacterium]
MASASPKKKFRLFDAVLAAVCIVLVVESAAPAAAIGKLQYFWWFFLLIAFFLPYALVSAELGSTYDGEGGLYDWVKAAYGPRAGSRVAWYYWINFPLWMVSLAVVITDLVPTAFGVELPIWVALLIQLVFLWAVIFVSNFRISESKAIVNFGAIVKAILILAVGGLGIWALINGNAPGAAETTLAVSPLEGISFISIILFNFMGFEVVATFASDMENPKREIPRAIIVGGVLIAFFYLFAAFGIGSAIPVSELSVDSGFLDSFMILIHSNAGSIATIAAFLLFVATFPANLISWGPGVNFVAMYAARDGALPKVFASENKHGMPLGANLINGIVATIILIFYAGLCLWGPEAAIDGFWSFFALSLITLLASYLYLFPAFAKLRRIDGDTERPFKVGGGPVLQKLITWVPFVLLIVGIIFTLTYYDGELPGIAGSHLVPDLFLIAGVVVAIVIGEILAARAVKAAALQKGKN